MSEQSEHRAYYFGAWNGPGHYLWTPGHARVRGVDIPWHFMILDGELAPGGTDCPFPCQVEGAAQLHHRNGWTALAFWDRSCDRRPGSNSAFLFDAVLDFDAAVNAARKAFPSVFGRFSFELRPEWGE